MNMNQIIVVKQIYKKQKNFFKIQFIISILVVFILGINYLQNWKRNQEMTQISNTLNKAFKMETMYSAQKSRQEIPTKKSPYFGKILIPKINLEYSIFNECSDELLRILPCKFYGVNLGEKGNIAIAGHNYDDNRFFGNLETLKNGDSIFLQTLAGENYRYIVYDKQKVQPDDFKCLEANRKYDLTLVTCDNLNNKRLIIKASR